MLRLLCLFSLCAALACSGGAPGDAGGAPPEGTPVAAAAGGTADDAAGPASQTSSAVDAPADVAPGGLPEPTLDCATDDDCVVTGVFRRSEAGQCCRGCSPVVGNAAWHEAATAACAGMGSEGCKPRRCAPLPGVVCDRGKCAIRPL